ncbi:hypothetical protein FHY29_003392 [Xanthomonas arboricola]|uniref:DUF6896 domain-containing protein n=1 Tax=Xanthomonas arboricola TaxID=56448 RepID=UPI000CEE2BD5|nr:hypothetical protein [Xanthomonas arboricola]PPU15938.1 hypothetical protein XarbCFBP7610_21470 [Xanthomonas arboricola]PPU52208.1 hypothetical protein XarbCFBP6827_11935 [Xanthomonas arboricola]
MNSNLARLISDYQSAVREAIGLMRDSGIKLPTSNADWAANGIPQRGTLKGDIPYFKHGYGCSVKLPSGAVDFDFGEHGETNGFDAWRLASFSGPRLSEYGFVSEASLNDCFTAEVAAGSLVYSGYILHYIAHAA